MRPEIVIVDTNVVVSGVITGDATGPTARILDWMIDGSLRFVLSPTLVAEYLAVLNRPSIVKLHGLTSREVEAVVRRIVQNGVVVEPSGASETAPDRGDQHLWDLLEAVAGATLVTGDSRLRGSKRRSRVMSPAEFVALD